MNEELLQSHIKWAEAAAGPELFPYQDSVGVLTIGYGRNLDDKGISRAEAGLMLVNDMEAAIKDAKTLPYWHDLDPVRQLVLADMSFNLGLPKLLRFKKMHAAIELTDYKLAAHEMKDSKWYRQTERRAKVLYEAMLTGIWNGH
jgi:lysozyme